MTLQNAFNAAPVSNGAGNAYAGALIGNQVNAANLTVTNTVTNCYNAAENVALFGTEVAGTQTNLYTIGDSTDFSAGILTDSDMKKAESFNGFDFDAIWEMNTAGSDYSYPQLIGNPYLCTIDWGTEEHPYEIVSPEAFQELISAHGTEGVYFKLTQNISLPDTYQPLPFSGIFDGNGKTVTVNIILPEQDDVGLFSKVCKTAVIRNLTIDGTVTGRSRVGGISGSAYYASGDAQNIVSAGFMVENCTNLAAVTGVTAETGNNGSYVGGIIGYNPLSKNNHIPIRNCENQGTISGHIGVGGIAGLTYTVETSRNFGSVSGNTYTGGVIGNGQICKTSYNHGKVSATGQEVGGIAGYGGSSSGIILTDCYNTGDVFLQHTSNSGIGGILSTSKGKITITACYSVGNPYRDNALISNAAVSAQKTTDVLTKVYILSAEEGGNTLEQMKALNAEDLSASFVASADASYPFPVLFSNANRGEITLCTVHLPSDTANGKITPSGTRYLKKGDTLKIKLEPDKNCMLDQFLINDDDLTSLVLSDMTVSATFIPDERRPEVSSPAEAFSSNLSAVSLSGRLSEAEVQTVIGKPVLLAFATAGDSNAAYTLLDYGMVLSKTVTVPEINQAGCIRASIKEHFEVFRPQYGVLFYGEDFIQYGTVYYIRPYAVYRKGEETIIIYGERVMEATPFSITAENAE